MRDFQGKVVLIAGAGEKVSPCLAHRFSKLGASVAVQASDDADIQNVSRLLPDDQLRNGFLSVVGDPNNVEILRKAVDETAEKFGRIDLLVLNPEASLKRGSLLDEADHRHMETTESSNRQLVELASPILKQSSGVIVNLFRSKHLDTNFEQFQKGTDPITDAANGVRVAHVNLDATSVAPHPDEVANLVVFLARKNDETLKLFSVALLAATTFFIAFFAWLIGPVAQPTGYHNYADKRKLLGIPFAAYVLSNIGFTLVGGWAFWRMKSASPAFRKNFVHPTEIQLYQAFFAIIAVTGLGSAYYHWNPNNGTLLWDRLPIAMATMALLAALITERASVPLGRMLSGPLIFFGALSSLHWWWTEFQGRGDLRLYALVTLVPALFYPLLLVAFPSNFSGTSFLVAALLCFGMARVTELNDHTIFWLSGGTVGGHVLKHIFATIAVLLVAFYVRNRRPIGRGAYYLLEIQFARKAMAVGSEIVSTIKQFLRRRD